MREQTSTMTITSNDKKKYNLMSEDEAFKEISKTTKEVNEILSLPSTTVVRLILNYFKWDKDTLTEQFFNDSNNLFEKLNIANPYLSPVLQSSPFSPGYVPVQDPMREALQQMTTDQGNPTCRICYSVKPSNEFYALRCRHQHCLDCWQIYLEHSINQNGCLQPIYCPSKCIEVVDDEKILELLSNNKILYDRYHILLLKAFVQANQLTQWCPGNGCATIVKLNSYSTNCAYIIDCDKCQTTFCFQCLKPWHEPIQCSLLAKWAQKDRDESMTGTWIVANTKVCPKCHSNIEKNGGCNHMTCRKPGCGHEFCWLCFGDWKDHATRQCNVYQESEAAKAQSDARAILERYIHYFTRYKEHDKSLELESKLLEQVEARRKEMEQEAMPYADRQSLENAFKVLQACRRTLKYTYPFAYYLERNNQSEIFEENQANLERQTEFLSGFLEREFDGKHESVTQLRDKTSFCEQRRKILLQHCKHGYSTHAWQGLDPY